MLVRKSMLEVLLIFCFRKNISASLSVGLQQQWLCNIFYVFFFISIK